MGKLETLSGVPVARQKVMAKGLWKMTLKPSDTKFGDDLTDGKWEKAKILMMGTSAIHGADGNVLIEVVQPGKMVFAEDLEEAAAASVANVAATAVTADMRVIRERAQESEIRRAATARENVSRTNRRRDRAAVQELSQFTEPEVWDPRFVLARSQDVVAQPARDLGKRAVRTMDIAFGALFVMLAPHEILSLARSCTTLWATTASPRFTNVMLTSVVCYLRLTNEAATAVKCWNNTLPRLVKLCEDLVEKVYGPFDPDEFHRSILAENLIFKESQKPKRSWDDYVQPVSKLLEQCDELHEYEWADVTLGDLVNCFGSKRNGEAWAAGMMDNVTWMQAALTAGNPVSEVANSGQKKRITAGLHPVIFLLRDTGAESVEFGVMIGEQNEQQAFAMSSYYMYEDEGVERESFEICTQSVGTCHHGTPRNGMVDMMVHLFNYNCTDEGEWRPQVVARAIWCRLHDIAPFNHPAIQWDAILDIFWSHNDIVKGALDNPEFRRVDPSTIQMKARQPGHRNSSKE